MTKIKLRYKPFNKIFQTEGKYRIILKTKKEEQSFNVRKDDFESINELLLADCVVLGGNREPEGVNPIRKSKHTGARFYRKTK